MTTTSRRLVACLALAVLLATTTGCRHVGVEVNTTPGGVHIGQSSLTHRAATP